MCIWTHVCAADSAEHIYHRMCGAILGWCCWHESVQNSGKTHAVLQNARLLIASCTSRRLLWSGLSFSEPQAKCGARLVPDQAGWYSTICHSSIINILKNTIYLTLATLSSISKNFDANSAVTMNLLEVLTGFWRQSMVNVSRCGLTDTTL